jgi:hypothetical protein
VTVEPLHLSFTVDCPAEHAFAVWTGRIFERTSTGTEHDWAR